MFRTRTKVLPGNPRETLPFRSYYGITHTTHHEAVVAEPTKRYDVFTDAPRSSKIPGLNFEARHTRVDTSVMGHLPDWKSGTNPYITYYGFDTAFIRTHEVPTMSVLGSVFGQYSHRLTKVIDWDSFLSTTVNYPMWAGSQWKGPKVTLRSGFSFLNFMFEWHETGEMFKQWFSKRAILDRWHEVMGINNSLGQRAKAVANERLAYVYGSKLFVQDAFTLFKILVSWKARADKYLAGQNAVQRFHREPLFRGFSFKPDDRQVPIFEATGSTFRLNESFEVGLHATLYYTYKVREVRHWLARLAQLSDSLGVTLDPGIVWDAIPYSFIIDWFVNISEWMHNNSIQNDWQAAEMRVLDYVHSGKVIRTRSIDWLYTINPSSGMPFYYDIPLWSDRTSYYRRYVGDIPDLAKTTLVFNDAPFKVNRVLNAAALAIQRIH